jgi:hypothetical protein
MAFLGNAFDPTTVPPADDFTPLPSGEYPAMIIDSEMKPTKAGTGQYLELTFQVIDGPMKNRLVWSRLNLENPNPKAVEIAQRDLSAICAAAGIQHAITDSTPLHNRPLVIRVEFVPAGPKNNRDGNEIKAYKRLDGAPQASPFAATPAQQAAPPPPAAAPGWAHKPAA